MLPQSICRHAQYAAKPSMNWCLKPLQQRMFSTSRSCQKPGVVPAFTKTSSPEIDAILERIRKNVIFPAYLSEHQKRLVTQAKNFKMIQNDPIFTNIGGERFRLEPILDPPSINKSLNQIIEKMDAKDVDNILPLLEGLMETGARIPRSAHWTRTFLALFSKHNREDLVLAYIRQASDTGFVLANPRNAADALRYFFQKAKKAEWEPAATEQALSWSEQVLDLMEDPKHKPSGPEYDPRLSAVVLAQLVHLAAKRAQQTGGQAEKKKLADYAARLLLLDREAPPEDLSFHGGNNFWLLWQTRLAQALAAAAEVLEPSSKIGGQLKDLRAKLEVDLTRIYTEVGKTDWAREKVRWGIREYEEEFGKPKS